MKDSDRCGSGLRPCTQVVLGDGLKGVQACPSEALNESLVDVRRVWPHRGVAAARSGLTCSLCSAPSE
jgi:hypothetical protein